jgi:hypothetical protein
MKKKEKIGSFSILFAHVALHPTFKPNVGEALTIFIREENVKEAFLLLDYFMNRKLLLFMKLC